MACDCRWRWDLGLCRVLWRGVAFSSLIPRHFRLLLGIIRESALCRLCRYRHKRHTFAVHRLEEWYRAGENLNTKLSLLATYMGHRSMAGTQWYLQLTQALFTDLAIRLDDTFGYVVPVETES